jgi:hypothetical protein
LERWPRNALWIEPPAEDVGIIRLNACCLAEAAGVEPVILANRIFEHAVESLPVAVRTNPDEDAASSFHTA